MVSIVLPPEFDRLMRAAPTAFPMPPDTPIDDDARSAFVAGICAAWASALGDHSTAEAIFLMNIHREES